MSLSEREQQALDFMAEGLADSAPKLASLLATFARLTSGEQMPVHEKIPLPQVNRVSAAKPRRSAWMQRLPRAACADGLVAGPRG